MAEIEISRTIDASVEEVWQELEQIELHAEWMADAVAIEFESEQRRGVGTRISVDTRVGPLRTTDRMEFVTWQPPNQMGVRHQGLVGGVGEFTLLPSEQGTVVRWREDLEFPWYFGGPAGAWLARPVLRLIWRRNLDRLAARF